jgi:hypothetical protein
LLIPRLSGRLRQVGSTFSSALRAAPRIRFVALPLLTGASLLLRQAPRYRARPNRGEETSAGTYLFRQLLVAEFLAANIANYHADAEVEERFIVKDREAARMQVI